MAREMTMKNLLGPGSRARLLALVLGLGCAPAALAQSLPFTGRWLPDGSASGQAASSMVTVKETSMSWKGPDKSAPACVQAIVLKQERPGTVYLDGRGTKFVAGAKGSFPTYLFALADNPCGSIGDAVRISFPLAYDTDHMELVEYLKGRPVGSRRFRRKK